MLWAIVEVEESVSGPVRLFNSRSAAITCVVQDALDNGYCPNVMGPNELREHLEECGRYTDGGVLVEVVVAVNCFKE